MAKTVVGLFEQPSDAQAAFQELQSGGFSSDNVHLIDKATGRMSSALTQAGVPQDDAALYDDGVRSGGALIIAQALPDDEAMRAVEILDRHKVVDISRRSRTGQQSGASSTTTTQRSNAATTTSGSNRSGSGYTQQYQGNEMIVPIIEEQIQVGKQQVEGGGVRVQTHVTEKPVNQQVTLHEEEVHVERRPVNQPVDAAKLDQMKEGAFEVREMDERAVVSKEARVVEEVVINKEAHERTENIQDTVRRTDVNVEELPGQTRTSQTTTEQDTTQRNQRSKN
ncbi:MAG: YsnF/AvaK domain-containing protein [Herpetosiphonaceae bacterium]|nr:YsnF/AvaK domain-containing protein [Herpetosiphonaceae bacterium]